MVDNIVRLKQSGKTLVILKHMLMYRVFISAQIQNVNIFVAKSIVDFALLFCLVFYRLVF